MDIKPRPLFVTGLARSGSNLLGRMLSVNKDIMLAMDPYLPLFKSLRNAIVRKNGDAKLAEFFDNDPPLQDYYFDDREISILDMVLSSDLDIPFQKQEWPILIEKLISRASDDAADIVPFLDILKKAKTYRELFEGSIEVIAKARESQYRKWVGAKDVWTIDFFPALARSFQEAKFLVIIRDPRATVASNQPAKGTSQFGHPVSYASHWRKNISLAINYKSRHELSSRIYLLFYEDLVSEPRRITEDLCSFLEVNFDPAMLEPKNFIDYSKGGIWEGNSSFQNSLEIDQARADRWRNTLEPEIIKMVEFICGPEMRLAGYEPYNDYTLEGPEPGFLEYYIKTNGDEYSWRTDFSDPQKDFGYELFRYSLLSTSSNINIPLQLIRRCFLFENIFNLVRHGEKKILY
jgi:hypothetical protein